MQGGIKDMEDVGDEEQIINASKKTFVFIGEQKYIFIYYRATIDIGKGFQYLWSYFKYK